MTDLENVRTRTVRVPLDVTVTRPYRRGHPWTVEANGGNDWRYGHWRAEGASEKAAVDTLTGNLHQFLEMYRPPTVLTYRGYTAVVAIDTGDAHNPVVFRTDVRGPDGRRCGSGGGAEEGWDAAEAYARYRLAHHATDWHDDDSVHAAAAYVNGGERFGRSHHGPEGFYEYAAWQRAAKAAMDEGRADWREWAGQHAAEYAVPRPTTAAAPAA